MTIYMVCIRRKESNCTTTGDGWRSQSTWPTHPEESSIVALFSHQASSIDPRRNRLALVQTLPQLRQRWPLRDFSDLSQQIIRERHAGHGRAPSGCDAKHQARYEAESSLTCAEHTFMFVTCQPYFVAAIPVKSSAVTVNPEKTFRR